MGNKGKIPHYLTDVSYVVEGSIKELLDFEDDSKERIEPHTSLDESFSKGYLKGLERFLDEKGIPHDEKILSDPNAIKYITAGYNHVSIMKQKNDYIGAYLIGSLLKDFDKFK